MAITERGIECPQGTVIYHPQELDQNLQPIIDKKLTKECERNCANGCLGKSRPFSVQLNVQKQMIEDTAGWDITPHLKK